MRRNKTMIDWEIDRQHLASLEEYLPGRTRLHSDTWYRRARRKGGHIWWEVFVYAQTAENVVTLHVFRAVDSVNIDHQHEGALDDQELSAP